MQIAGGLYRELCEMPRWDVMYGSGGRAAAAVSAVSPGSVLHTYARDPSCPAIDLLRRLGLQVCAVQGSSEVVFAYFHPLSDPHIEPHPGSMARRPPLHVHGEAVLRFGMLEGDAIVSAKRAVYDPQTQHGPRPFSENGSSARELALVLNEAEICTMAGIESPTAAAEHLMKQKQAEVVVVKRGPWGADVHDSHGSMSWVPAYRSKRVFKIGTGDVFSALFAYHWAECNRPPSEAAVLASRAVAAYCGSVTLPLPLGAGSKLPPAGREPAGPVALLAAQDTLGRRWVAEEARFRLQQLGVDVVDLTTLDALAGHAPAAVLVLSDGVPGKDWRACTELGVPVVALAEARVEDSVVSSAPSAIWVDDFVTAIYQAVWSTSR